MSEKWQEAQRRIARALLTGEPARVAGPYSRQNAILIRWSLFGRSQWPCWALDGIDGWQWRDRRLDIWRHADGQYHAMAAADAAAVRDGWILLDPEDIPAELREGGA